MRAALQDAVEDLKGERRKRDVDVLGFGTVEMYTLRRRLESRDKGKALG